MARHNPEKKAFKGKSYKKGGEHIRTLKEVQADNKQIFDDVQIARNLINGLFIEALLQQFSFCALLTDEGPALEVYVQAKDFKNAKTIVGGWSNPTVPVKVISYKLK